MAIHIYSVFFLEEKNIDLRLTLIAKATREVARNLGWREYNLYKLIVHAWTTVERGPIDQYYYLIYLFIFAFCPVIHVMYTIIKIDGGHGIERST